MWQCNIFVSERRSEAERSKEKRCVQVRREQDMGQGTGDRDMFLV